MMGKCENVTNIVNLICEMDYGLPDYLIIIDVQLRHGVISLSVDQKKYSLYYTRCIKSPSCPYK